MKTAAQAVKAANRTASSGLRFAPRHMLLHPQGPSVSCLHHGSCNNLRIGSAPLQMRNNKLAGS